MTVRLPLSRAGLLLGACAAAILAAGPARAQADSPADRVTVTGRVLDRTTGQPLSGVRVAFEALQRSAVTTPDGRFQIAGVPEGTWLASVYRIGYAGVQETWQVDAYGGAFEVALDPNPVLLDELRVNVDEFERRRRATAMPVRVISHEMLLSSAGSTALDVVMGRGVAPVLCPAGEGFGGCVYRRGSAAGATVVVDEIPMPEGLSVLRLFEPRDLYMIEIYAGGRHIRVYTTWYMEREARRGMRPFPLILSF